VRDIDSQDAGSRDGDAQPGADIGLPSFDRWIEPTIRARDIDE
jgi:hypothetical protein